MNAAVGLMDGLGLDGDRCIRVIPRQFLFTLLISCVKLTEYSSPFNVCSSRKFIMQFLLSRGNDQRIFYRPQRSCGKVIFSQVSVILSMGGVSQHALGQTPPWVDTPTPGQTPPPHRQTPLAETPWADTPCPMCAGIHTPLPSACWDTCRPTPGGRCCGQYVSYWNAYLLRLRSLSHSIHSSIA